ncbi:MAG: hypothetical protein ISS36_00650 [Candidatus Aenigmarchaeota archaeon]|nr:hypothetical protein [Candidatus Aenigmarchaeota archaeon]
MVKGEVFWRDEDDGKSGYAYSGERDEFYFFKRNETEVRVLRKIFRERTDGNIIVLKEREILCTTLPAETSNSDAYRACKRTLKKDHPKASGSTGY